MNAAIYSANILQLATMCQNYFGIVLFLVFCLLFSIKWVIFIFFFLQLVWCFHVLFLLVVTLEILPNMLKLLKSKLTKKPWSSSQEYKFL